VKQIGDKGTEMLAEILKGNTTFTQLHLEGTHIRQSGTEAEWMGGRGERARRKK